LVGNKIDPKQYFDESQILSKLSKDSPKHDIKFISALKGHGVEDLL
jgi:hypothetical protein